MLTLENEKIQRAAVDLTRVGPTRLLVDLDCLAWNVKKIREATTSGASVCASIKANAYGHGAAQIAGTLLENGADSLSVATLDEGAELRRRGVGAPILILGPLEKRRSAEVVNYGLAQTVCSYEDAAALSEAALSGAIHRPGVFAKIHIKIDTGMNRIGFECGGTAIQDILSACALPRIDAAGIFTHFAISDNPDPSYTLEQIGKFNNLYNELLKNGLAIPIRHCSNSAAIMGFPEAHMDMVRPGIALYGGGNGLYGERHKNLPLKRAMTLVTAVTRVKKISVGESVGYGRRFIAKRPSIIATLAAGYADGYDRLLSCGNGSVLIHGKRAKIAGTICMDQCMADITGTEGVAAGDEAVLLGRQGDDEITFKEVSEAINTVPHDIMCAIGRRVPRIYYQGGAPVSCVKYLDN